VRSGRATVGEPRKNDDLERTRDQKRRSNSSANADPEPIGDRNRTEEPGLVTNRLKTNSSARASIRMSGRPATYSPLSNLGGTTNGRPINRQTGAIRRLRHPLPATCEGCGR